MSVTHYDNDKIIEGQKDFYNWFNELDKRRGTDFKNTFPEMLDFYHMGKKLK
jgi:hypothetical protein